MRSNVTVKQIISDVRMYVGTEEATNVPDSQILTTYNLSNQKIYQLLNGAKANKFGFHSPLGAPASYLSIGTDTASYTAATKTISGTMAIDSTWIGSLVVWTSPEQGYEGTWFSHIISVIPNTSFVVKNGGTFDCGISFIVLKNPTPTSFSLDGYRIDRVKRVHFTNSGDSPIKNEDEIEAMSGNPNYTNDVAVCVTGTAGVQKIKCVVGTSTVNSGGFPIVFGDEMPYWSTSVNDYVDLPLEFHSTLFEDMSRGSLIEKGIDIPKALESSENIIDAISQMYQMTHDTIVNSRDK